MHDEKNEDTLAFKKIFPCLGTAWRSEWELIRQFKFLNEDREFKAEHEDENARKWRAKAAAKCKLRAETFKSREREKKNAQDDKGNISVLRAEFLSAVLTEDLREKKDIICSGLKIEPDKKSPRVA